MYSCTFCCELHADPKCTTVDFKSFAFFFSSFQNSLWQIHNNPLQISHNLMGDFSLWIFLQKHCRFSTPKSQWKIFSTSAPSEYTLKVTMHIRYILAGLANWLICMGVPQLFSDVKCFGKMYWACWVLTWAIICPMVDRLLTEGSSRAYYSHPLKKHWWFMLESLGIVAGWTSIWSTAILSVWLPLAVTILFAYKADRLE